MLRKCPYEQNLDCDGQERVDEYYRQLMDAMNLGIPVCFISGANCPVDYIQCMKLRAYCEKQNQR